MKQQTATSTTPNHSSMVTLLIRLGANPVEAYNATEGLASEARQIAKEVAEGVKMQVLSRIDALHVALVSFKSEVAAKFEAVDRRFESVEREMRTGFNATDQRFDMMHALFDSHLGSYRRLLLLLVVPVALAILAGVGGMVWEGISNWVTQLP